jgi:hypothetical protein
MSDETPKFYKRAHSRSSRAIAYDLTYQIRWEAEHRKFVVYRGEVAVGQGSPNKDIAVGIAVAYAKRDAATGVAVEVVSFRERTIYVEWTS